ncbi:MAG: GNAT family N-acetyltransferase [Burkholderiaceae bacterium]
MTRIEPIDQRELSVAQNIHAVLLLAHAQEARLLQVKVFVPMAQKPEDLQQGNAFFLGALRGEALLACLSLVPDDDEPGQIGIGALVVHPDQQRQGLARRLVVEALRRCAGQVVSVTTGALNTPALALYRGLGFVEYRRGTLGAEALEVVKLRRAVPGHPVEADAL